MANIHGVVVALNLWLKRLEIQGRAADISRINKLMLTYYPAAYFTPWILAMMIFGII